MEGDVGERKALMENSVEFQDANSCFENWNSKSGVNRKQIWTDEHPPARTSGILFLVKHQHFSWVRVCRGQAKPSILTESAGNILSVM